MRWSGLAKLGLVTLLLLTTGLLAWQFHQQDAQSNQSWVEARTRLFQILVQDSYRRHLRALKQWERYWQNRGLSSPQAARALLDAYRQDYPELQALGLVQNTHWYALSAEAEPAWRADAALPRKHLDSIQQARNSGAVAIPYDFHFPNDQRGVYLYFPIKTGERSIDVAMLAISLEVFMQHLLDSYFAGQPVRLIVRDERRRVLFDSAPEQEESGFFSHFLLDPDGDGAPWEFMLLLTPEGVQHPSRSYRSWLLLAGLAIAALLAVVFRISSRRGRLVQQLEARETHIRQALDELEEVRLSLQQQLYLDESTGLPNRKALIRDLREAEQQPGGAAGHLLCIRLLGFDQHREVYGYENGKEVLQAYAERLRDFVAQSGLAAECYALEGGEFALWLRALAEQRLEDLQRQWLEACEPALQIRGMRFELQQAMGVVALDGPQREYPDEWLQQAEVALSQAVLLGHGSLVRYRKGMLSRARRRMELGSHLRDFLREERFSLYYQPVMDLATGKVHALEAFMRLHHPDFGTITPVVFMPLAEGNGSVEALDRWALRQACQDWTLLKLCLPAGARLELNVSHVHWQQPDYAQWLLETLESAEIRPEELTLNLTRQLGEAALQRAEPQLRRLNEAGVCLALDVESPDFGALALLNRLHLSLLKIDRKLVLRLLRDDGTAGVVHGLLEMADQLQLRVCAEGVESGRVADWLRDAGCHYAQGYYFEPPLPLHTLVDTLSGESKPVAEEQNP